MSQHIELVFMDSKDLYKRFDIIEFIRLFQKNGFEVKELKVGGKAFLVNFIEFPDKNTIDIVNEAKNVYFISFNPIWNLEFYTGVGWGIIFGAKNRIFLRINTNNTPYFWRAEYQPDSYSNFMIDFGKQIYGSLFPEYGWIDFDGGGYPDFTEIEQGKISNINWANYLGPRFVQMIGREKILTSPVRRIDELSDGGILFTLFSCPGLEHDHVDIEKVREYFDGINVR